MKNLITTILLLSSFISCKAQSLNQQVIPIENINGLFIDGIYYKDVNDLLNPYVGSWLYTNGTTSLKFVLRKVIGNDNGRVKQDMIVGEYEYIENGVTKINTLQNINLNYPEQKNHSISGNTFAYKFVYPQCNDCGPDERRLELFLSDPLKNIVANILIRKIYLNGQIALSIQIYSDGLKFIGDNIYNYDMEEVGTTIPNGDYTLIKLP